jgi:hypothetical protein
MFFYKDKVDSHFGADANTFNAIEKNIHQKNTLEQTEFRYSEQIRAYGAIIIRKSKFHDAFARMIYIL